MGLLEFREILLHIKININVQNILHMKKTCSRETTRGFLKTEKKSRIDYQCIMRGHYVKSFKIQSFFWSVFSFIWTEYEDLLQKSSYSAWIQENTDQKKTTYLDNSHLVGINKLFFIPPSFHIKIKNEYSAYDELG